MKRFLLALLVPIAALAEGGLPTQPYIYVQGSAKIEKQPDLVTLDFELSSLQPEKAAANKLVQAQANKVFALLKETGVADKDIIASDITASAEYEEGEGKARKLLGHRVSRPISVKLREIAKFPKLVDDLLALKVSEFQGVAAGLSDEEKLDEEMWTKAIAASREQADKRLAAAGMKVDSIFAISPISFPSIHRDIFGSANDNSPPPVALGADFSKVAPSEYHFSPIIVSQAVHVIYLIVPAR